MSGPLQLAKFAVQCSHHVFKEPRPVFVKLCAVSLVTTLKRLFLILVYTFLSSLIVHNEYSLQSLVDCVDYEHPNYHTVLVSLSQVAKLQSEVFSRHLKTIIKDNLVKNLFLVDRVRSIVSDTYFVVWGFWE